MPPSGCPRELQAQFDITLMKQGQPPEVTKALKINSTWFTRGNIARFFDLLIRACPSSKAKVMCKAAIEAAAAASRADTDPKPYFYGAAFRAAPERLRAHIKRNFPYSYECSLGTDREITTLPGAISKTTVNKIVKARAAIAALGNLSDKQPGSWKTCGPRLTATGKAPEPIL